MKSMLPFLLLLIFSFPNPNLNAQTEPLAFKHLTIDDGLSQNAVLAILQDHKGFMWFGTKDGLNRYDGYSFAIYRHNPFDSTSLSANHITALFEDSRGYLWIGTLDGGVNRMASETETFQRFNTTSTRLDDASPYPVTSIAEDAEGNMWIATAGDGLLKLATNDAGSAIPNAVRFKRQPGVANSLSSNIVNGLLLDSGGNLWAATQNGLNRVIDDSGGGIFEHHTIYVKNPQAPFTPRDSSITALKEGKDGVLWLGSTSGVIRFDAKQGKFVHYPHRYEIHRYGWGGIVAITEDQFGKLWFAAPAGLMRFDPERLRYDYFRNDPFDPQSISFSSVSSVWRDRAGVLWFGTPGYGISLLDPKAWRFRTLRRAKDPASRVTGFSVRSILEDRSGNVWISTDVLYRWNRKTGEIKSFETSSNFPDDFGNTGAWAILQAADHTLYFATNQGLYLYEPASHRIKHFKFDPTNPSSLPQKEIYTVFEDQNGAIWIGGRNYLSMLTDRELGAFRHFQYRSEATDEVARTQIYEDGQGRFWLGTSDGLKQFDPTREWLKSYRHEPGEPMSLSNNVIKSLCPDPDTPDRILWIGTSGGGLNRFDMVRQTFRHYTEEGGLPNNVVYGILPDESGNLWLSTNKGLSRFDRQTETFRNYDVRDGLQSNEFNTGAFFRSESGEMFFGGINGMNYFYPKDIIDNPHPPPVVITGFRILNRTVSHRDSGSILEKPISETDAIALSHGDNFLTFEFTALDFSAPEKNQYAYMMENFNEDWVYSGSTRFATYTNLSPGEYVFRVKGSNNDGIWNEQGASLRITILPPWWQTWWAYTLYVLAVIGILFGARQYELNRIRWKNRLKLEQVEGEKLKELDRLKSHFFANISHEFRTPLTLILGQVENVQSAVKDMKERAKLQVALRNARRLLRLINELLDLSKLESGAMQLRAETHNVVSFLKNLVYSFESLARQKHIDLEFRCQSESIPVRFDPDKMEKVFFNLLSNAFKFTPVGGRVEVEVDIAPGEGESEKRRNGEEKPAAIRIARSPIRPFSGSPDSGTDQYVEIKICDTGIGIPAENLPYVFNRFYQIDSSHTRVHEGSGIGLALAKELVELHGGEISVSSKVGRGTEFIVELPIAKESSQGIQIADFRLGITQPNRDRSDLVGSDLLIKEEVDSGEAEPAAVDKFISFKSEIRNPQSNIGETVLIVEDNEDVRAYIREQLQGDYALTEAGDGEAGLARAQEAIPDLIITDVMMPKMDGYQLSREIRRDEKTSHIPIIMLTARAALDDKLEGLETGVDAYLYKPFSAKELKVRVQNLIRQRRELRKRFSQATVIKPSEVAATSVDQTFLENVVSAIETHFGDEQFNVECLAEKVNMSVSQLNRKLGALIDQPAGQLIRSMRLQRAADLLRQNAGNVAQICYEVGFGDQANFTKAFKRQFGVAPSEFRKLNC